jgi:hypothetical protein
VKCLPWFRRLMLAAIAGAALTPPLQAQATPEQPAWLLRRADVYFATRERWRGIRRNAHPILQGDALAGVRLGRFTATAGGYGAAELGNTKLEPRLDLRAGTLGFSTTSVWGQVAFATRRWTVSGGAIRERYRRVGPDPAVWEVYGTVRYQQGRWAVSAAYWQAVDGAEGSYVEPAVTFYHFVNPFAGPIITWSTSLAGGIQLSERNPDAGALVPGPEEEGLTHVVLGSTIRAAVPFVAGSAFLLEVGSHLQLSVDSAARRRRDGSRAAPLALWFPLRAGISYPLRRPQ